MNNNTTNVDTNNSTVELKVLLSDVWRGVIKFGWIAVALSVLLGGLQFYRSFVRFTPVYTVTATFTVQTENKVLSGENGVSAYSFYYDRNTADQLASVFPNIISSPILLAQVKEDLEVESMPATVTATCIADTNMITLTAKGGEPQLTYDTLMSVIDNYSSVADYIIGRTKLVMISDPVVPETPSNKMAWRSSVLRAALIGAAIGVGWILVYAILRKTIRTKEDIRNILNQNCIGVLPQVVFKKYRRKINTDIILTNPLIGNDFLESLRLLRSSVSRIVGEDKKVVMVTSTAPDEGKSVVTVNLASIFAKNNSKMLVIDFDLRNSGVSSILKEGEFKTVEKDEKHYEIRYIEPLGFDLLTFNDGEKNLQSIIRTPSLKKLFSQLKEKYDLILIDTPPCGIISDASIIAGAADAVIYVIRQDAVMQNSIRSGINAMLETETPFLGCILNGATGGLGGYGNYYKYGGYNKYYRYGYGYSRKYGYGGYGYGRRKKSDKNK